MPIELISLEHAMKAYGLSWMDIKRSGVQVYRYLGIIWSMQVITYMAAWLYIDKADLDKLKAVRTVKKKSPPPPKKGKPKVNSKKKIEPWTGYSPSRPSKED